MAISDVISQFSNAIEETRARLASVGNEIANLEADRFVIQAAKPHTDDIVAAFQRALESVSRDFEAQLGSRLQDTFVKAVNAADAAKRLPFDLLRLAPKPDQPGFSVGSAPAQPSINVAVLAYFLRHQIAEEIPDLVDRLCPDARNGMKSAEREASLADLDARLAALRAELEQLNEQLAAAQRAVWPGN